MSIILSLLLSQVRVLPEIDRRALDAQARAEAQRSRQPAAIAAAPRRATASAAQVRRSPQSPVRQAAVTTPRRTTSQPVQPAAIRRAAGGPLDLAAITSICRAAGNQADPASFIATLSRAYSLDGADSRSLRTSCAAYLAGRDDARDSNGAPAH